MCDVIGHHASTMLLLFAKYPAAGRVKTRVTPALGAAGAARLHRRLMEAALDSALASGLPVTVCSDGAPVRAFRAWLGDAPQYLQQTAGDLGARMQAAFADAFWIGATKVVAIGADVPGLTPELLQAAEAALDEADVVLGPAADGGYYLIGMRHVQAELFRGIDWGTDAVLAQTKQVISDRGLHHMELPVLADIDRPEDLEALRGDGRFGDVFTPTLTVIIPTLQEEAMITETVAGVRAAGVEIIVADGGSVDQTCARAEASGAKVLHVQGGRAAQMNAAATQAQGSRLLFLHADTRLPEGYVEIVHRVLDDSAVVLGAFRFQTDSDRFAMRLVEWGTNIRACLFGLPYGDQALFMGKRQWQRAGGFPSIPIMEDYALVRTLRRMGRVQIVPAAVITSARRWEQRGILRTSLTNQLMLAGYAMGVPASRLANFYRTQHRAM